MKESELAILMEELDQLRFEKEMNEVVIEGLRKTVMMYRAERNRANDTIKQILSCLEQHKSR